MGIALTCTTAVPAQAQDAAGARRQARAAAAQVHAIELEVAVARQSYEDALRGVGSQVSDFLVADGEQSDAQAAADAAQDRAGASARALYLSGGQAGLLNSVLESGSIQDLATRVIAVDRVMSSVNALVDQAQDSADRLADVAAARGRAADAAVVNAAELNAQADHVTALLDSAQRTLDALSATAKSLTEAEQAAKALEAARQAAQAGQDAAISSARAQLPPEEYFRLYRAAAVTCRGMDWTLLAAVGQVESGHGRNAGVSSAGAVGPMQFMPATFYAYAVDGDHDGRLDPYSPADAIYTAAHYLCTGGAGSPSGVRAALYRYNHADWYVDLVLSVQQQIRLQYA